jgi:hypothetical protein
MPHGQARTYFLFVSRRQMASMAALVSTLFAEGGHDFSGLLFDAGPVCG